MHHVLFSVALHVLNRRKNLHLATGQVLNQQVLIFEGVLAHPHAIHFIQRCQHSQRQGIGVLPCGRVSLPPELRVAIGQLFKGSTV